jgi:hypothetical protein
VDAPRSEVYRAAAGGVHGPSCSPKPSGVRRPPLQSKLPATSRAPARSIGWGEQLDIRGIGANPDDLKHPSAEAAATMAKPRGGDWLGDGRHL